MPNADVTIVRQGEPPWSDIDPERLIHQTDLRVAILEGGMASGAPSVALRFDLPDGEVLIAETSLATFTSVMAAARGAFPEAFARGPFAV